jgi:hypothetical protein
MNRYSDLYTRKMLKDFADRHNLSSEGRMELAEIHEHGCCCGRNEIRKDLSGKLFCNVEEINKTTLF